MCSDDPNLPAAANKAKCHAVACFVFSIFSMIGFGASWGGAIGAVGGAFSVLRAVT